MMGEMLEMLGMVFEVAKNGSECMERLKANPDRFNTILMDIHMPEKSGVEALADIRGRRDDPPRNMHVVAVTADTAWHDEHRARAAGFNSVLPKPVNMAGVKRAVLRAL
ncbi:MAG: response regulator, partial [Paracoccaceae bacterium]